MKLDQRDHAKLICDIGELSGIFVDAPSLDAFLQKIVEMISEHMKSQVCSIYLYYEDKGELVLKATKGLNPDSVGKVKMKLGEGLTGLALEELAVAAPVAVEPQFPQPLGREPDHGVVLGLMPEVGDHHDVISRPAPVPTVEC